MNALNRVILAARWRFFFQSWFTALGWLILGSICVAGVLLVGDCLFIIHVPKVAYLFLWVIPLFVSPVVAWWRYPSRERVAGLIDRRFELKDCVSSALYALSLDDQPFADQVVRDAQHRSRGLAVGQAFPFRFERVWIYVLVSAIGLVLVVFLPPIDLFDRNPSGRRQPLARTGVNQEVIEAVKEFKQIAVSSDSSEKPPLESDTVETLRQLSDISEEDLTDPDRRQLAAEELSKLQEVLTEQSQSQEQMLNDLFNTMSRLDPGVAGSADRFSDALRRGDFQAAQKAMMDLAGSLSSMTEADRRVLHQQIENLAKQLQEAGQEHARRESQSKQQLDDLLNRLPFTEEQIDQLTNQDLDGLSLEDWFKEQGIDPAMARQLADQVRQLEREGVDQRRIADQFDNFSRALDKSSDALDGRDAEGQRFMPDSQAPFDELGSRLSELARMREQLRRVRQAQDQTERAISGLYRQDSGQFASSSNQAGAEDGGNALSDERKMSGIQSHVEEDIGEGSGRVITSWLSGGEPAKGESTVGFNRAVEEARGEAEQAITEDRVPRRYHETLREYFNQIPQTVDQIDGYSDSDEASHNQSGD